jgi:hypothetical protein
MLFYFAAAAAGEQRDDGTVRIEAMPRREFGARHRWANYVNERMPDEIHGHSRVAIKLLFERENYDHPLHQPLNHADAPGSPSPDLRTDKVAYGNSDIFEPARYAEMRSR